MRPRRIPWWAITGHVLHGVGVLLYVIGAYFVLMGNSPKGEAQLLSLLLRIPSIVLIETGYRLALYGKRLAAKDLRLRLENVLARGKPFVLYLRSFQDDEITAQTPVAHQTQHVEFRRLSTEEEHVKRALRGLGTFIAIDRPDSDDQLPPSGAARVVAGPDSWQAIVLEAMSRTRLVIVRAGESRWLWWEVEQALQFVPGSGWCF